MATLDPGDMAMRVSSTTAVMGVPHCHREGRVCAYEGVCPKG